MKANTQRGLIIFICGLLLSALIARLGGYNFDHRSLEVAVGFGFSLSVAVFIGALMSADI